MSTTAREFLDEVADMLRAKGRTVEVTETEESFGTMVWLYSPAPRWFDRTISLGAIHSERTNRWKLCKLRVGSSVGGDGAFERKTRTSIRIATDVFA